MLSKAKKSQIWPEQFVRVKMATRSSGAVGKSQREREKKEKKKTRKD